VLASSRTRILVDAGVSCREIGRRMNLAGDHALNLSAVIISHEHSDHVAGLYVLARKLNIPIFMTGATYQAWQRWARDKNDGVKPELARLETFEAGRSFTIGDITVAPFTIPHDAADPVGFTFRAEGVKIGVVTDLRRAGDRVEPRRGDAARRALSVGGEAARDVAGRAFVKRSPRAIFRQ
jgi:phosphoribosyl 1,2-cyclic phosphodiesterase